MIQCQCRICEKRLPLLPGRGTCAECQSVMDDIVAVHRASRAERPRAYKPRAAPESDAERLAAEVAAELGGEVPFGPSGLMLYQADINYLERRYPRPGDRLTSPRE